ncbi:MAG: hypothetical protein NWE89_04640 [Candidatus Bathyarchaeota archaeon]|nr:hypothetical protein [Candidatus Bathyarchaeota archaeon]
MTLKVEKKPVLDESNIEFLRWIEELRNVKNEFDALLEEYEQKKEKIIEAIQ